MVKNPTAMLEIQVQSLGWEDPLEEGMGTHSSQRIPWTEEPGGLRSIGLQRVRPNLGNLTASHLLQGNLREMRSPCTPFGGKQCDLCLGW